MRDFDWCPYKTILVENRMVTRICHIYAMMGEFKHCGCVTEDLCLLYKKLEVIMNVGI